MSETKDYILKDIERYKSRLVDLDQQREQVTYIIKALEAQIEEKEYIKSEELGDIERIKARDLKYGDYFFLHGYKRLIPAVAEKVLYNPNEIVVSYREKETFCVKRADFNPNVCIYKLTKDQYDRAKTEHEND